MNTRGWVASASRMWRKWTRWSNEKTVERGRQDKWYKYGQERARDRARDWEIVRGRARMGESGCAKQSSEHCSTLQCPAPAVCSAHHPAPCTEKTPAAAELHSTRGLPADEQQAYKELLTWHSARLMLQGVLKMSWKRGVHDKTANLRLPARAVSSHSPLDYVSV